MVSHSRSKSLLRSVAAVCVAIGASVLSVTTSRAAEPATAINRGELSPSVEVNVLTASDTAELQRARACLEQRQWEEAIEIYRRLSDLGAETLIEVRPGWFIPVRKYCQMELAALPREALAVYRRRVDDAAGRWYAEAIRRTDGDLLRRIVDEAFASSWGDKALDTLAQYALEEGDTTTARWCWSRILPISKVVEGSTASGTPQSDNREPKAEHWPEQFHFPESTLDPAAIRARLVLCSIIEGSLDRAADEWERFRHLHPTARGRWGGIEVSYAEALRQMLDEASRWPDVPEGADWPTFAGNARRNGRADQPPDPAGVLWRAGTAQAAPNAAIDLARPNAPELQVAPPFFPIVTGHRLFLYNGSAVVALRVGDGTAAWGTGDGAIFRDEPVENARDRPLNDELFGRPLYTLSADDDRLFVRLGSPITTVPLGRPNSTDSRLACFDLTAQGRLLWKIQAEPEWTFEGAPLTADGRAYIAMRRAGVRVQFHIACFEAATGRLLWRRFVCAGESLGKGSLYECSHQLLSTDGRTVFVNTNLGAVAALDARSGRIGWLRRYPRGGTADDRRRGLWQRDPSPCLIDRSLVFAAPMDSPFVFAFDAADGQLLWRSSEELSEARHLLGARGPWLIAGGTRLYWIARDGEKAGRIVHRWPDGPNVGPGIARGTIAGSSILFPTKTTIEVFDLLSARHRRTIDLLPRGVRGGNLLVANGMLFIATDNEIIAFSNSARPIAPRPSQPLTMTQP